MIYSSVRIAHDQNLSRHVSLHFHLIKHHFMFFTFSISFFFLGQHPQHTEVPRLGVIQSYSRWPTPQPIGTQDLSCVCNLHHSSRQHWIPGNLHHSSQQHWIPDPRSETRGWTCILMDTSWICYHWATRESPDFFLVNSPLKFLRRWSKSEEPEGKKVKENQL